MFFVFLKHASFQVLLHCAINAFLSSAFLFSLPGLFVGLWNLMVVELNCEIHIAHNLKIKEQKSMYCGILFSSRMFVRQTVADSLTG